jgi:hypothetical protein
MWLRAPTLPAAGRRKTGPPFERRQTSTPWIGSLEVQSLRFKACVKRAPRRHRAPAGHSERRHHRFDQDRGSAHRL